MIMSSESCWKSFVWCLNVCETHRYLGIIAFQQGLITKGRKRLQREAAAHESHEKKRRVAYMKSVKLRDLDDKFVTKFIIF